MAKFQLTFLFLLLTFAVSIQSTCFASNWQKLSEDEEMWLYYDAETYTLNDNFAQLDLKMQYKNAQQAETEFAYFKELGLNVDSIIMRTEMSCQTKRVTKMVVHLMEGAESVVWINTKPERSPKIITQISEIPQTICNGNF